MEKHSRVYAKIDLDALEHNLNEMSKSICSGAKMVCVVKTDGYGHGAVPIAQLAQDREDVWGFAVATVEEAVVLRENDITKPILILGFSFPEHYEVVAYQDLRPAVFKYEMAKELSEEAMHQGRTIKVHVAVDTGMSRIGYQVTEEAADEVKKIADLPGIEVEGLFTHFAKADETDKAFTYYQIGLFEDFRKMLLKRQVEPEFCHCSNSAGITDLPEAGMDLVRPGIILYGLYPSEEVYKDNVVLKPVMELKSHIAYIKLLEADRYISYGGTYHTTRPCMVATIPVGYGDGYPRGLSNKGYVLIHGKKAPILGRVCMDQFMVDVTDIPEAQELDEVTLVGCDGNEQITVEELGELADRFNYEFVCCVGKRVPRIYYRNGSCFEG